MTTLFSTNVHVYGKCRVYVGVHELLVRVHEHGNDSHFLVYHHQNGCVHGVSHCGNDYARVQLIRVHANVHALP